jgi:lipid A 3-O-deacylase
LERLFRDILNLHGTSGHVLSGATQTAPRIWCTAAQKVPRHAIYRLSVALSRIKCVGAGVGGIGLVVRVVCAVARVVAFLFLFLGSAWAQSPPSPWRPRDTFEARFGAFAHDLGGPEKGSADFNAEVDFPQLWHLDNHFNVLHLDDSWNWLVPRPHVGAMINTDGRTSYIYGGALWTFDFTRRIFLETFLGGALHNGSLQGDATHAALGCPLLYHLGASAGFRILPKLSVMFTFDHISNGRGVFSDCPRNVGLSQYGIRFAYSFH